MNKSLQTCNNLDSKQTNTHVIALFLACNEYVTRHLYLCIISILRMELSDQELLNRIQKRDTKAFHTFYERYARLLYKWAYNRTKNVETTNEITQSFWEHIWLSPSIIKTDKDGFAKNFLLRYFTFRILDYLKAQQNELFVRISEKEFSTLMDNEDLTYSHILEELGAKEIHQLMNQVLADLPEISRKIFHLKWELNYSTTETASTLGLKEKEIYNRYHRLIQAIREKITLTYLQQGETASRKTRASTDSTSN